MIVGVTQGGGRARRGAFNASFLGNMSQLLKRARWERLGGVAARRRERELLARELHDTVVRRLMEIGQACRFGREAADTAVHFAAIEAAAEDCMQTLRGHLRALTSEWDSAQPPDAAQVLQLLGTMSGPRRLQHGFRATPGTRRRTLTPAVAAGLLRIGREALQNAELHADGARVEVELLVSARTARLTIDDDGAGIDPAQLPLLLTSQDHLGLRQMRATARELSGHCRLTAAPIGGLRVDVSIPIG